MSAEALAAASLIITLNDGNQLPPPRPRTALEQYIDDLLRAGLDEALDKAMPSFLGHLLGREVGVGLDGDGVG